MIAKCQCGRVFRHFTAFPIHCGCGDKIGQASVVPSVPRPRPPRTIGRILREMVGCGCQSLPWQQWDRRGIDWCRDHADEIAAALAGEPRTGLDPERARGLVGRAIEVAQRSASREPQRAEEEHRDAK